MTERPVPVFRIIGDIALIGTMATYNSQAEASEGIPPQWREFRSRHPTLGSNAAFYGASPCTADRRIHYLSGVSSQDQVATLTGEPLTLEAGEYAMVRVDDPASLRDTWIWLLGSWLPTSGRQERKAPEFEKFTAVSEEGLPIGPVEIWIPLEPPSTP